MTSQDLSEVTKSLEATKVDDTGELSFKGQGLKLDSADSAKEIIDAIEQCKNLTALRLEGNTVGVDAAEAISKALEKHPEFQRARWSDMFTGRLKSEIPLALKSLGNAMIRAGAQLVELDLSHNAFGPNGVEGIVDLLKSKTCYTLKELRLNNNGLGPTGGTMLAGALMDCFNSSRAAGSPLALRVFISGRGRLENEGAIRLAEVFKLMGSLEELSMVQNGIYHEGITALSEALGYNTNLRILDLSDNTFTEAGARSMAKVLPKLQKLEVINLGDCLLRTEGVKAIAKSIKQGHQLLRVTESHKVNRWEKKKPRPSWEFLGKDAENNIFLKLTKELNLSGNDIRKSGADKVTECVENKDNLELLDLNCNTLGEEGIELVKASLEAIGKIEILETLSGDEGTEDEDEEEGEYDEGQEDEEAQEEKEGEAVNDPELQVTGKAIDAKQSVKDFLSFPSPTKLKGIAKNLSPGIKQELGANIHDPEQSVLTLVRISTVVTEEDTKNKQAACQCADDVLTEVFSQGREETGSSVANAFLVYLGLLKGEDKKYRPPSDITGPLIVLHHVVKQSYFPRQAKKLICAFMDKPHPLLTKSTEIRNQLLQTLYTS